MSGKETAKVVAKWWRTWVVILVPILLAPLPAVVQTQESFCAFILILMSIYWVTEALPMAVTALLPLILVPYFGIMPAKEISLFYMQDANCLFIASLFLAICIENSNLHKRIALRVLLFFGTSPRSLMTGFMLPTWFLSMWISNTATTAMMMPIVNAVLEQIREGSSQSRIKANSMSMVKNEKSNDEIEPEKQNGGHELEKQNGGHDNNAYEDDEEQIKKPDVKEEEIVVELDESQDDVFLQTAKCLSICIAFAANSGGIATLTGTGTNLVLKGIVDDESNGRSLVSFSYWMAFALPISICVLLSCWLWLQLWFLGIKTTFACHCQKRKETEQDKAVTSVVKREYESLGALRWEEAGSLGFFVIIALMWFSRSPGFVPGWGDLFKKGYVTDATAAMTVAVLIFAFPSEKPKCDPGSQPCESLLTWNTVVGRMPWGFVFLLGGGFALAEASDRSGLSIFIGRSLVALKTLPMWTLALVFSVFTAIFTEFTSNTTTTTILLPIAYELSELLVINPLYLMLSVGVTSSFAFMFPVSAPPNAIAFSYGYLSIVDMAKVGLALKISSILIACVAINTWAYPIFKLNEMPDWVPVNRTQISP